MTDSKDLLLEREDIIDKIDLCKLLTYQLELDSMKENAIDIEESISHSLEAKRL